MKSPARNIECQIFPHYCQADQANITCRFSHENFLEELRKWTRRKKTTAFLEEISQQPFPADHSEKKVMKPHP